MQGSFAELEVTVLRFIRKHWVAYLIGCLLSIALGLGLAYYIGNVWTSG